MSICGSNAPITCKPYYPCTGKSGGNLTSISVKKLNSYRSMQSVDSILKFHNIHRIALKLGGAKCWWINLHANIGRLNFGKTSTIRESLCIIWRVIIGDRKVIHQSLAPPII